MGIRYYAYAFDAELTDQAIAEPRAFIGEDPLADAWGLEPGARLSVMTGVQALPETEMLYLDKAWRPLQDLFLAERGARRQRPCARMFEGDVTLTPDGWTAWLRVVEPIEVGRIARDLAALESGAGRKLADDDAREFLGRAVQFATTVAEAGRGFVYMIG